MLWEQLLALTVVALAWRQILGGWFGLGIFLCPKGRWNQLLGRALHGLWLVGRLLAEVRRGPTGISG